MIRSPYFFGVLNHLSRFLGITSKFIPIYKDIKPIASHIPEFLNKLSNINLQIREKGNAFFNNSATLNDIKQNNTPVFFK